ncbi:MAG: M23 family metallopeptidase [Campylobacterales bacterium]|nr:M23 family metallopeptidase [Campylobacterales bacterium]
MKRRLPGTRKKSGLKIVLGLLLIVVAGGAGYIYTAAEFEREAPSIEVQESLYWNKKVPLQITLKDNRGLKNFELLLSDGKNNLVIGKGEIAGTPQEQILKISYPKSNLIDPNATHLMLRVSVDDSSLWNLFRGNHAQKTIDIHIDDKSPSVSVLANTRTVTQGGSALVVFAAEDENMDSLTIEAAGEKFKAVPYKKEGYYAALIAWPFLKNEFSGEIIATDKAGNSRKTHIPFYIKQHKYKVSWIEAKDSFIDGKITDLASSDPEYSKDDKLEKLRAINETMRLKNEDLIHSLGRKLSEKMINAWHIDKFYPLKNGQKVASFGDERHYYYKTQDQEVSHSYHLGYDLASTKMATIQTSNPGTVVFAGENGIYGNMPMIDHGLGLYTLYGHCSKFLVSNGEQVKAGDAIAQTGTTGLALGDHLHFGVLVQGVEVRPVEWFDTHWIKTNIDDVLKEADKIIEGK